MSRGGDDLRAAAPRPVLARVAFAWLGVLGAVAASCGEVSSDPAAAKDSGIDGAPDGFGDDAGDAADAGAEGSDSDASAACPVGPPSHPTPCDAAGISCTYSSADGCCGEAGTGTFHCNGSWWSVESTTCMPPTAWCPDAEPDAGSPCSNCNTLGNLSSCSWLRCPEGELHNASCSGGKWKILVTWDYLCPPPDAGQG